MMSIHTRPKPSQYTCLHFEVNTHRVPCYQDMYTTSWRETNFHPHTQTSQPNMFTKLLYFQNNQHLRNILYTFFVSHKRNETPLGMSQWLFSIIKCGANKGKYHERLYHPEDSHKNQLFLYRKESWPYINYQLAAILSHIGTKYNSNK